MAGSVVKGDRVHVNATYFDAPGTENAWSKSTFGERWNVVKCYGIVKAITGCVATVKWDIDKTITKVRADDLRHDECAAALLPLADTEEHTDSNSK